MPQPEGADADAPDEALLLRIHDSSPAFCPSLRTSDGGVNEVQVDVSESAFLERLACRFPHMVVTPVLLELGRVEDRFAWDARLLAEVQDCAPALPFIFVPLGCVL